MTQGVQVGRLALLLLVPILFRVFWEDTAAKTHDGVRSATYAAVYQTVNASTSQRSIPLIVEHVTIITGSASSPLPDATLVIRDGRIVQLTASNTFTAPPGVQRVDATGKFAIPGLWDMHVHLFNSSLQDGSDNHDYFFPLLIANGIVGVRDLFTTAQAIAVAARWNEDTASGRLIGPRVMVTGRGIDGEAAPNPASLVVHNAVEARQAVRNLKASGAKSIKVLWSVPRDAYFALADEAKRQAIAFGGHVPWVVRAAEVSDAGQRTIEHMDGILEACSTKEDEWLTLRGDASVTPARRAEMLRSYDDSRCEALAHRFAKNGTWMVPTAANFRDPAGIDLQSRRRYVLLAETERWMTAMKSRQTAGPNAELRQQRTQQMMQAMRRAGVRFLSGTDLSSRGVNGFQRPFHIPGVGLHDELALFVSDGFTPGEALRTATSNVAEFVGSREFGTLEPGKRADVILLDANPLEDIHNTRKIHAVILGGRLFSRGELDDMVNRAVGRVSP